MTALYQSPPAAEAVAEPEITQSDLLLELVRRAESHCAELRAAIDGVDFLSAGNGHGDLERILAAAERLDETSTRLWLDVKKAMRQWRL
jgi:hypothetical protein